MCTLVFSAQHELNAQNADTEIYLLTYSVTEGQFKLESFSNVSHNAGFDNHPCFSADGSKIYYSTMLDGKQTDIYEIDLVKKVRREVTRTKDSEYYPTIVDEHNMGYINVDADSSSRLFTMDLRTNKKELLIKRLSNIGAYHWINSNEIALFLTSEKNNLVLYNLKESTYSSIAVNTGTCFSMIPNRNELSFVDKSVEDAYMLKSYNLESGEIRDITPMLSGVEHYSWLSDNQVIVGSDGKLAVFDLIKEGYWTIIADLKKEVGNFDHIAVSPIGGHMAIVNYSGGR